MKRLIIKVKEVGFNNTFKLAVQKIKVKIASYVYKVQTGENGNYKIKEQDSQNQYKKEGRKIFIFAGVPYYDIGGGQRCSQLAKIYDKMGYQVIYVYAFNSNESKIFHLEIPTSKHIFIDEYKKESFEEEVDKEDLVIFEMPTSKFLPFLEASIRKGAKIVYENIDNWETSLGSISFDEKTLKKMLKHADLVTGTAMPLVEQNEEHSKRYNIPINKNVYNANAVDDELFNPNLEYKLPEDLITGKKTLIYYGSLWGDWFNWDIIFETAKKLPDYSFNLIGDYHGIPHIVSVAPENVHFLGLKKQKELPAYLKYSDFSLLPFKADDIGKYVSPLKIFEYMAMNVPVLATGLPDIKDYPNIFYGDTSKEWIKILKRDTIKIDIKARNEFVINNNWYARCTKILDNIYTKDLKKTSQKFYGNIEILVISQENNLNNVNLISLFGKRYNYNIRQVKIEAINEEIKKSKKEYIFIMSDVQQVKNHYWLDNFIKTYTNTFKVISSNALTYQGKASYEYEYNFQIPIVSYRADIKKPLLFNVFAKKEQLFDLELDEFNGNYVIKNDLNAVYSKNVGLTEHRLVIEKTPLKKPKGKMIIWVLVFIKSVSYIVKKSLIFLKRVIRFFLNLLKRIIRVLKKIISYHFINIKYSTKISKIIKENKYDRIVIFENTLGYYQLIKQRPQHIAEQLAKKKTLFIYGTNRYNRSEPIFENNHENLILLSLDYFRNQLFKKLEKTTKPKFVQLYSTDYVKTTILNKYEKNGYKIIYEYIDEIHEDLSNNNDYFKKQVERFNEVVMNKEAIILASADKLYDDLISLKSPATIKKLKNGVVYEDFAKKEYKVPTDLVNIKKKYEKVILYYGALATWFDYELLIHSAKENANYAFVLIGMKYDDSFDESEIKDVKNIFFLGKKEYDKLHEYSSSSDLLIIPFVVNDITKSTSPVKVFEYMASKKPILTTNLPECLHYSSVIIAKNQEEFSNLIPTTINKINDKKYLKLLEKEAKENTWDHRAQELIDLIK